MRPAADRPQSPDRTLGVRLVAEFVGATVLLVAIVGSGIGVERLVPGQAALPLLANAIATGLGLAAAITMIGSVSGGQLNPVVTLVDRSLGGLPSRDTFGYVAAQLAGAFAGVVIANLMFSVPAVDVSETTRSGWGLWLAEGVATFGLVVLVFALVRSGRSAVAPFAIGGYVAAAILATSSTAFANPAVTFGRMFSNTFSGIAPSSVPEFVFAQLVGGAVGLLAVRLFFPSVRGPVAEATVVPHEHGVE